MSLTTLVFIVLIGFIMLMHLRRGGHGGGCCGGHDHTERKEAGDGTA